LARDHRRLAAIVLLDVVGYSRLMGEDESGTLAALKAHRRELIDPKIAEHDGRIVKGTGDGLLLEFPSVVDAVRCAVDVQRGMAERNAGLAAEQRLDFRIGINVGDIIIDGDDIFGDGVNVAARLESLADPGGICVSRVVRDQVLDKLSFTFEDLGAQQVKNIARPIDVYRVDLGSDAPPVKLRARQRWPRLTRGPGRLIAAGCLVLGIAGIAVWAVPQFRKTAPVPAPAVYSIAILPFSASASSAADGQLAETLAQALTSALGRSLPSSRVVSYSVAANYRSKPIDAPAIGRELNVRYLVEGEAHRAGDRILVDARLVDAVSGAHVWGNQFELVGTQLPQDHDSLIRKLVTQLGAALWNAELRRFTASPGPNATTGELSMHAYAVWYQDNNTLKGAREARKWFDQALRLDPSDGQAIGGRWRTLLYELDFDPNADAEHLLREMDEMSFRAVSINNNSGGAWGARAETLLRQRHWESALETNAKAEKLDPNSVAVLGQRSAIMYLTGRPAEALALVETALALEPQFPEDIGWVMLQRCRASLALGRYDDAVVACEKSVAVDDWWLPHLYLVAAHSQKGKPNKASTERARLLQLRPGISIAAFKALRYSDDPDYLLQVETQLYAGLRKAGIPEN